LIQKLLKKLSLKCSSLDAISVSEKSERKDRFITDNAEIGRLNIIK